MLNKDKKTILIFIDWFEPAFKGGGPIRSIANFGRNMSSFYNIYVFTGDRDLGDTQPFKDIPCDTWLKQDNMHVFYASHNSLKWKKIKYEIATVCPDFVYLNSMYARYFTVYPLLMNWLGQIKAKVIIAPRGMLQEGALQFKAKKKLFFLRVLNMLKVPATIYAHATDLQEAKDIREHLPGVRDVSIIPNFSTVVADTFIEIEKEPNRLRAVFISRVAPKKNLLFLLALLKHIPETILLELEIRGSIEDDIYWAECLKIIKKLPNQISLVYNGPLQNREVPLVLSQHHIFILPTLGENFGHAIFEALAAGRPVVISNKTPWKNLAANKAGWDLPLIDAAFIDCLIKVAKMGNEEFSEWTRGARRFAKLYYAKPEIKAAYINLFS